MSLLVALVFLLVAFPEAAFAAGGPPGGERKGGPPPAPVVVAPAVAGRVEEQVTLVGTAEPQRRSVVASDVEGIVEALLALEGAPVRRGEPVARLRTDSLEIALRGAVARRERARQELAELEAGSRAEEVEEARAAVLEAEASYQRARRDVTRYWELYREGAVALQSLQDAETAQEAVRQRLEQARARLRLLEAGPRKERIARARAELQAAAAEVAGLEDEIARTTIEAPFDGVVTAERTQRGQWVGKGGAVVEMVDLGRVEIVVQVPERLLSRVRVGRAVRVRFDALGEGNFAGEVMAVVPQADVVARTFPVKVRVPNREGRIKAGMFARVSFPLGGPREAVLVPKDAVVQRAGGTLVFVLNDDTVHEVPVRLGPAQEGAIAVEGPIRPGQLVVVRGNERLRSGQTVQVQNGGR